MHVLVKNGRRHGWVIGRTGVAYIVMMADRTRLILFAHQFKSLLTTQKN